MTWQRIPRCVGVHVKGLVHTTAGAFGALDGPVHGAVGMAKGAF